MAGKKSWLKCYKQLVDFRQVTYSNNLNIRHSSGGGSESDQLDHTDTQTDSCRSVSIVMIHYDTVFIVMDGLAVQA